MKSNVSMLMTGAMALTLSQTAMGGTDIFFNPLTQSAAVATVVANGAGEKSSHFNELNHPWQTPAGISQINLTSMSEIEAAIDQSVVRAPGAGTSASMWDMVAFDDDGEYIFIPHESPIGAGVTRYDIANDKAEILFSGDANGASGDWSNDWGAFDPATFTPNQTLLAAEEWSGQGRVMEITNPFAAPADIQKRELNSIPNVSHEGLRFSADGNTLYFVDEWNSGSLYKIEFVNSSDYSLGGQVYVLSVDAFDGVAADYFFESSNAGTTRTGSATWIPMTDQFGTPLTTIDPFKNGVTADCRSNPVETFGGRCAADELGATPYGRPEDMEVARLGNGNEVIYFTATSEQAVYSVEELGGASAMVRIFASDADTPKNLGFPATTATLNSPDNLAQDALGNIYIIEDQPNGNNIGGDIWFVRDTDNDGVAESIDHFLSIVVDGAEATGMIFNPANPTQFVVAVQHPDSTDLSVYPEGFGDALWMFDLEGVVPPVCDGKQYGRTRTCSNADDFNFVKALEKTGNQKGHGKWKWSKWHKHYSKWEKSNWDNKWDKKSKWDW